MSAPQAEACASQMHCWAEEPGRLKFSLGGWLLFRVRFRALVYQSDFQTLPTDPWTPVAPLGDFRAALINSHPLDQRITRTAFSRDYIRYAPSQYRRFYIDLDRPFEEYLQQFSAQRRSHLKRVVRKFAKFCGGQIHWREFRRPAEMREFHRLAREVSRSTYQEKLVDAGLPITEAFIEDLLHRAERDQVRGYILFHEDTPIAYEYCPVEGGVLVYERVGYNAAYAQHSPGMVLLYLSLEHLFGADRFRRFDFGKGEYAYKEVFSTGFQLCADIYYFRRTAANLMLIFSHTALDLGWQCVAGLLDRLQLRQKLKKTIRMRYGK